MPQEIIALPALAPSPTGASSTIGRRRSSRTFDGTTATPSDLGRLLWAGQGISGPDGARTVPSADQQYPLTLFVVTEPAGMLGGLCRYRPDDHALDRVDQRDLRHEVGAAAIGTQPWVGAAPILIIIAAAMDGIVEYFHDQQPDGRRGVRYAHLEAGAAAQNIALRATDLGLGSVLVGGFDDAAVGRALGFGAGLTPLAFLAIGRPTAVLT